MTEEKKKRVTRLVVGGTLLGGSYGLHKYGDQIDAYLNNKVDAAQRRRQGRPPDEIGGSVEDKLERMARRAKGTPEGAAALHKLTRLREKQGQTIPRKAGRAMKTFISKIIPRKVPFGGHLLSAREQFQSIIELGLPKNLVKKSSAVAQGDLDLLRKSNMERLRKTSKKKKIQPIAGCLPTETHLARRDQLAGIIELKAVDLGYSYGDVAYPCDGDGPQKKHYPSLNIYDRPNDIDLPLSGKAVVSYKLRSKTVRQNEEGVKKHSADIEIQSIDPIEDEDKKPKEGEKAKLKMLNAREELGRIIRFETVPTAATQGLTEVLRSLARQKKSLGAGKVVARQIRPRTAKGLPPQQSSSAYFASRVSGIIQLSDTRPRNPQGEFIDSNGNDVDPNAIASVYKSASRSIGQNLAGGAVAGVGAAASGSAVKALFAKLKKARA